MAETGLNRKWKESRGFSNFLWNEQRKQNRIFWNEAHTRNPAIQETTPAVISVICRTLPRMPPTELSLKRPSFQGGDSSPSESQPPFRKSS